MYSELVPKVPQQDKTKNIITDHINKRRDNQKHLRRAKKEESCDRLHKASLKQAETLKQTSQRKQSKRQYSASVRQTETAEDTAYRCQYNRQYKKTSKGTKKHHKKPSNDNT